LLKNILSIKGGKTAQAILNTGAQAGLFTAAGSAVKGEFPSGEDYATNLAAILGFKLFDSARAGKAFYDNAKKAGVQPQQAAKQITQFMQRNKLDPKIASHLDYIKKQSK